MRNALSHLVPGDGLLRATVRARHGDDLTSGGVYNLLPAALRAELYPGDRADVIDFSLPTHTAHLREGWYDLEGDFGNKYRWIGPRATAVLRAVPELAATLPCNAVGKDFRPGPYLGLTDSGTGLEASLWGLLGVKFGWIEGIELNALGLVVGLDIRHPAVKLPGFGRLGLADGTAIAAPAPAK